MSVRPAPAVMEEEAEDLLRSIVSVLQRVSGFIYLIGTVVASVWYLVVLYPSLTNDHMWPGFNSSGTQTYLSDIFNAQATTYASGTLDLFAVALPKEYSTSAVIDMRVSAARRWLLNELALDVAVQVLRRNSIEENVDAIPAPCWVDYKRLYGVAHTAKRQANCERLHANNTAMYMEVLFRNCRGSDLLQSPLYAKFNQAIFQSIRSTPAGILYVDSIESNTMLSLQEEVAYMKLHGLTHWKMTLQNLYHPGIHETISIVNAWNTHRDIVTQHVPTQYRGKGAWTTQFASCGLVNDLETCETTSASLVRSSASSMEALGYDWDLVYNGPLDTPIATLVRSHLGPFMAIDIQLIPLPPSLLTAVSSFQAMLYWTSQTTAQLQRLPEFLVHVRPPAWQVSATDTLYYGGNPLCPFREGTPYMQELFGVGDDCGSPTPLLVVLGRPSVLFALAAMHWSHEEGITAICRQTDAALDTCVDALTRAGHLHRALSTAYNRVLLAKAVADVKQLNLTLIQFATYANATEVLVQPVVSGDPWDLFGWIMLYEWVDDLREAYVMHGDEGTYRLLSRGHSFLALTTDPHDLPHNATALVWAVCVYVSGVLVLFVPAACWCIFKSTGLSSNTSMSLLRLNRVVGSVWIGRSILALRGITALVVLSTSPIDFVYNNGVSRFAFSPRSQVASMLLAGEATWITYALNELLAPVTDPYTSVYAPLSAGISWVSTYALNVASPVRAVAEIGRVCSIDSFRQGVQCTNGAVYIGRWSRMQELVGLQLMSLIFAYMIARFWRWIDPQESIFAPRDFPTLAPGTTQAYFDHHVLIPNVGKIWLDHEDEDFDDDEPMNVLNALMCGIVPLRRGYFDIKLWVFYGNKLHDEGCSPTVGTLHLEASRVSVIQQRWRTAAGVAVLLAVTGVTVAFNSLATSVLVNDVLWHSWEAATYTHVHNWCNAMLQGPSGTAVIAGPGAGSLVSPSNTTTDTLVSSPLYANAIQDSANSLSEVVRALRVMDRELVAYISTAYCFVDLRRRWELALSFSRQQRCTTMQENGAVYLETILRNTNGTDVYGDVLDTNLLSILHATGAEGATWVAGISYINRLSVEDEVSLWRAHGIRSFTMLWQNYKLLGIVETIAITNALGTSSVLTLKHVNATMQWSRQTSLKMTPLFGDMLQVNNLTNFSAKRHRNASIVSPSGLNSYPLDKGGALLERTVGPYGTIDLRRVQCPSELAQLYRNLSATATTLLTTSREIQLTYFPLHTSHTFSSRPRSWDSMALWGGNLLCELNPSPTSDGVPLISFSSQGLCGSYLWDTITVDTLEVLKAVVAAGLVTADTRLLELTCLRDALMELPACLTLLNKLAVLVRANQTPKDVESLRSTSTAVKTLVERKHMVELVQYVSPSVDVNDVVLSRVPIFDTDLDFFAWLRLFAWVSGTREVVAFTGDVGTIVTMSAEDALLQEPAGNGNHLSVEVAWYCRLCMQYTTWLFVSVIFLAVIYIVFSRGRVEGMNLVKGLDVAGQVWIGNLLLCVRSLVALWLASTAWLDLARPHAGLVVYLASNDLPLDAVVLVSFESTWLVHVVHGLFAPVVHEAPPPSSNSLHLVSLVVGLAVGLSCVTSPVHAVASFERACNVIAVDFQVECSSGVIITGSSSRLAALAGVCVLGALLCVLRAQRLMRRSKCSRGTYISSFFLHGAAQRHFDRAFWIDPSGCWYFLDYASAVLAGLVCLQLDRVIYILDIKSWRWYLVHLDSVPLQTKSAQFQRSLPLVE